MSLDLEIIAPDRVIAHGRVVALQAADASGRFGIWPGHEDFLTVLVPCVLRYRAEDGRESFAAVDGGVLLLEDGRISVVTRDAVVADRLDEVADEAAAMLDARKEKEQAARAGFAELETSLLRELRKAERAMTSPRGQDEDPFVREIRRQAERAGASQHMTFWQGLSLVGSVGWMVVVPALLGAFLGRWIDRRIGHGHLLDAFAPVRRAWRSVARAPGGTCIEELDR